MFDHLKNKSVQVRIFCSFIILVLLLFLPIKMGEFSNKQIPIIGYAEQISYDYCDKTFKKAATVYASAKITDKVISTIKETRLQLTPMGLGLTIAPAEWLSAANDAIEMILAGATAVSVGTANFVDPRTTIKVVEGIESYMLSRLCILR